MATYLWHNEVLLLLFLSLYDKERHKKAVMLYNLEKLFLFFMARWAEAIFELLIIALCV